MVLLNQLIRYSPVLDVVESSAGTRLLEVGSGSRGITPYLREEWEVTSCDIAFDDYGAPDAPAESPASRIVASVLDLPFPDQSFDLVVALDLLEHLSPQDRLRALKELTRVTRNELIVGCPCGREALAADARLARIYDRLGLPRPGWLTEHLEHGFPDASELREGLAPAGVLELVPNLSLRAHRIVMTLEAVPLVWRPTSWAAELLRRALSSRLRPLARGALRLVRGRDRQPAYRMLAVLRKDG